MTINKFKKKTNNIEQINKIGFYTLGRTPKNCKIIKVNTDLSLVVIFNHKGGLYRWNCILDNIPLIKSIYYKQELEKIILDKYLEIMVREYKNGFVYGSLYDNYKSINAYFNFFMHSYETPKGSFKITKTPITFTSKLPSILE
jgi:hypothetical protein